MKHISESLPTPASPDPAAAPAPKVTLCDPDCEICGGSGYLRKDVPPAHREFGKIDPCPNFTRKQILSNPKRFGVTREELEGLNWDVIIPGISEGEKAVTLVRQFVEASKPRGLVYLYGDHGQAKTLILKIAVVLCARRGLPAYYARMSNLLDDIRQAYDDESPSLALARRLERWTEIPVLAIDEFERQAQTEWVKMRTFDLIDDRHVQAVREETLTLIASNTPPRDLDPALYDRIMDTRHHRLELRGSSGRRAVPKEFKW